ncbi:MAG: serine/threonine protein kinase [Labilithrix sp.]|nr:serine/threonine protein kinase [Labilithrix sp.]
MSSTRVVRSASSYPARPLRLGRHDVLGKIAGGGLSTIYLGRRIDDGVLIALKVVRHDLREDSDVLAMFCDEARLVERLVHPNIVRTFEHGLQEEHAFIAMELLIGTTLAEVQRACAAQRMGLHPEAVAWIGARIADALHHAHEQVDARGEPLGIIHRDVNPANVFLTFDGDVKLIDFGLAKCRGRAATTLRGVVKGKLPYLSPEQIMQLPLDRRSDVFGLGTTLWELCTTKRLFGRSTDAATVRAVHCGPIPDPRRLTPDIPRELAAIVMQTLQRNRERRYATAFEVARDLDRLLGPYGGTNARTRLAEMQRALFPAELERQRRWRRPAPGKVGGSPGGSSPPLEPESFVIARASGTR